MWNHNNHFHSYLLRQLPKRVNRVLDVGCGLGDFARKLAKRSEFVEALDADQKVIEKASEQNTMPNVYYLQADFLKANLYL